MQYSNKYFAGIYFTSTSRPITFAVIKQARAGGLNGAKYNVGLFMTVVNVDLCRMQYSCMIV